MRTGYEEAKHLLNHYMQEAWIKAGLKWDADNSVEVDGIIDAIRDGVDEQIQEALTNRRGLKMPEDKLKPCPFCGDEAEIKDNGYVFLV